MIVDGGGEEDMWFSSSVYLFLHVVFGTFMHCGGVIECYGRKHPFVCFVSAICAYIPTDGCYCCCFFWLLRGLEIELRRFWHVCNIFSCYSRIGSGLT